MLVVPQTHSPCSLPCRSLPAAAPDRTSPAQPWPGPPRLGQRAPQAAHLVVRVQVFLLVLVLGGGRGLVARLLAPLALPPDPGRGDRDAVLARLLLHDDVRRLCTQERGHERCSADSARLRVDSDRWRRSRALQLVVRGAAVPLCCPAAAAGRGRAGLHSDGDGLCQRRPLVCVRLLLDHGLDLGAHEGLEWVQLLIVIRGVRLGLAPGPDCGPWVGSGGCSSHGRLVVLHEGVQGVHLLCAGVCACKQAPGQQQAQPGAPCLAGSQLQGWQQAQGRAHPACRSSSCPAAAA